MAEAVIDASALVDLLLGDDLGRAVGKRLAGTAMHAPAHVDAEVLSALGRLHRAGDLDEATVESKLNALAPRRSPGTASTVSWSVRGPDVIGSG